MIVADTNLLACLLLEGEHTAATERVLMTDAEWSAPTLWRSEFRNVLALYLRRGVLDMGVAVDLFRQAERIIEDRIFDVDTDRVLALVAETGCSAYDCEFAALARFPQNPARHIGPEDPDSLPGPRRVTAGFCGKRETVRARRQALHRAGGD